MTEPLHDQPGSPLAGDQDSFFRALSAMPAAEVTTYASPGATERILYRDEVSGTYVRALEMPVGMKSGETPLQHDDFDEIVYVTSGEWQNLTNGQTYGPGTVAVFPAGSPHGPFLYPDGATFLEVRHYK